MKQSEIFGNAKWMGLSEEYKDEKCLVLRGKFHVKNPKSAKLCVIGLGYFHCYINGVRVSDEFFLPLSTDYEPRNNFPKDEIMTGHRIFVPEYDITSLLSEGENTIAIHAGGGWYNLKDTYFGVAKAIYRIFGKDARGDFEFVSSEGDKAAKSYVSEYIFQDEYNYRTFETHDLTICTESVFDKDFDDTGWGSAHEVAPVKSNYLFTECPPDRVCEVLPAVTVKKEGTRAIYDAGKNISGYPVLKIRAKRGEKVKITFSEDILKNGELDPKHIYEQYYTVISSGEESEAFPKFTWFGFRYFSVEGDAEVLRVEFVHTDLKVTSSFCSDSEILNWLNKTFINTQLGNSHSGIPSDCPHMEKRGYTGDGQLTCHTVMTMFDARSFYEKWIQDISDCQDIKSGHVQYTAPYTNSGGGPGGWGCAIVEVPYQYYLHYGDERFIREMFEQMLKYFEYLEEHSYGKLVISDQPGRWCLGDWCAPDDVALPAPFVNNYFYIKSMLRVIEIAKIIGREDVLPMLEARIEERKEALHNCYFNKWNGNYIGGIQGANAFAMDIGLEAERTYENTVKYYNKLGRFDTGIFGTDIVTRVLFERGDAELAVKLLTSTEDISFHGMMKTGATTIWEQWPKFIRDRSRNHPMFGAVTAYLYDYLLGIRAKDKSPGYREIVVAPFIVSQINELKGTRALPGGEVAVEYKKTDSEISFKIIIPKGQIAEFRFNGEVHPLSAGENNFKFDLK